MCAEVVPFGSATIDHWIPLAHGGRHSRYNFVLSCVACNHKKDNLIPADEEVAEVATDLEEIRGRYRQ